MQLEHASSIEEIAERLAPGRLGEVVVDVVAADVIRIEMPAGGGVAGQPVNAYLVGRAAFVLVDPGDPTGEALDRALEVAAERGGRIVAIALTHADPDHAAGAEAVAEQLGIPVLVGPGGGRHLPYETREVARWRGHRHRGRGAAGRRDARAAAGSPRVRRRGGASTSSPATSTAFAGSGRSSAHPTRLPGNGPWQRLRSAAPGARWLPGHGDVGRTLDGGSSRPEGASVDTEPTGRTIDGIPWEEPRPHTSPTR